MVVGGDCVYPLVSPTWFARSLLSILCPLQSLCPALSSGVNHNASARRRHFPSPSLAGSRTWVSSTTRGRRLKFEGQPLLSHSMGREQGWGHLRATPGFGVFWFIPLFLVVAYLPPTSFIGRIFPCLHTGRRFLNSCWVVRPKSWRLEGVRIWKLSRKYPGEKPPSFSVLTHRCSLITRKPTWHLLAKPSILVRIRSPY